MKDDYAIGIDVGGTKIAIGKVDRLGKVNLRGQIPTLANRDGAAILKDVYQLAKDLIASTTANNNADLQISINPQLKGIGVSVCELVDLAGNVTASDTVKWAGIPVQTILGKLAPTIVDSDVRAHALAEAMFGDGQKYRSFIFVSVGTGISSCLVLDGKPHAGARGNAIVLSTMPVTVFDAEDRKVEFRLEPFASGVGMVERYNRLRSTGATGAESIVAAAEAGDDSAAQILVTAGVALGSAVAWLVNVLDPEAIIVGGGLGLAGGQYWDSFVTSTRQHIYSSETRKLAIIKARCGADAGIIGAAAKFFL